MLTMANPIAKIAQEVVDHVNSGAASDFPLWDKHWHDDFVSIEGDGMKFEGRKAVEEKTTSGLMGARMPSTPRMPVRLNSWYTQYTRSMDSSR